MKTTYTLAAAALAAGSLALAGCGAIHTAVKKRDLDVQTRMSETVFLEPTAPEHRIIYLSVRNSSDKTLEVKNRIRTTLETAGYRLTSNPQNAHFMLQANVLKIGKSDLRETDSYLEAGYGGAVVGAVASRGDRNTAQNTIFGAALGVVGDALVDDTLFTMITDLQVRERPRAGEVVTQSLQTNAGQGSATRLEQSVTGGSIDWKTYRTRIVSTANQVNLEFTDALPVLEDGLVHSVSGIFAE